MKNFRNLTLALLTVFMLMPLFAGQAQNEAGSSRRYRYFGLAFYNLENLFDTINNNGKYDLEFSPKGSRQWNSHRYWSKINKLSYAISKMNSDLTPLGPALIGVCEVENESVLNDLVAAESIRDMGLKVIHHDSPDRRGVDVGLLYNPRLFRPLNVTNHRLTIEGQPNFRSRDQMCVVGLLDKSRIAVIVNHWPSRYGGEERSSYLREAAAALTKSIADSLLAIDPSMAIVVMGDLNDDPQNKSCSEVLGALRNIDDVRPGGFYNPFWKKLDDGIGSYVYRGGWDLFDQIIVNYNMLPEGESKLKFSKAEVLNKPFLIQQDGPYKGYTHRTYSSGAWTDGYSDHLPTEIFVKKEITPSR